MGLIEDFVLPFRKYRIYEIGKVNQKTNFSDVTVIPGGGGEGRGRKEEIGKGEEGKGSWKI